MSEDTEGQSDFHPRTQQAHFCLRHSAGAHENFCFSPPGNVSGGKNKGLLLSQLFSAGNLSERSKS